MSKADLIFMEKGQKMPSAEIPKKKPKKKTTAKPKTSRKTK